MADMLIIFGLMFLTAVINFIAGFCYCQWGYQNGLKERRDDLMWESIEWD
jgi:hypothetical protein